MKPYEFDYELDMAWCPGCGNLQIRDAIVSALQDLDIPPEKLVMCSGIGQAAKMPQYINTNYYRRRRGR